MSRLLYSWELGGGAGHLAPARTLLDGLDDTFETDLAIRDCETAERLLEPERFRWFQAPIAPGRQALPIEDPASYAEILIAVGYTSVEAIAGRLRAWLRLIETVDPDLLVVDHAPTALLAARVRKIPAVCFGFGFMVPPPVSPFPLLRPRSTELETRARRHEDLVLARINEALDRLGGTALESVGALFSQGPCGLITPEEIDPYRETRERADYWGPVVTPWGAPPEWPEGKGERIFAYLKPFKTLPALVESLRESGRPVLIYMSQVPPDLRRRFECDTVRFTERPVAMEQATAQAKLVICHAGSGTVGIALINGARLLLLPLNLEQHLTAIAAEERGVALSAPMRHPRGMHEKLHRMLNVGSFAESAEEIRRKYETFSPEDPLARFRGAVDRLLSEPRAT